MKIANCPGRTDADPPTNVTQLLLDETEVLYITVAFVLFVLADDIVIVPELLRFVRVPTDVMLG